MEPQQQDAITQRRMSYTALLRRCWQVSNDMVSGRGARRTARRAALLMRCLSKLGPLERWWRAQADPAYRDMLVRHPLMPVETNRPYITTGWSHDERMGVVRGHYRLGARFAHLFGFPADGSMRLVQLEQILPGLHLALEKPVWFTNEGEVALSLLDGEVRLYSLLFTLGEQQGVSVAYVGALQGLKSDTARDTYRDLTHGSEGLRPRDLLFTSFRMLLGALQVQRVLAVSDDFNARRSSYFAGGEKLHFSLNAAWDEYGGTLQPDGFYAIDAAVSFRSAEDIPARKRAQYRRRYELLGEISRRIDAAVATEGSA